MSNFNFYQIQRQRAFFITIQQLGYQFSQHFVPILMQKFDFHKTGSLQFDGFVHSILMIRRLTAAFQPYDTYRKSLSNE